MESLQKGMKRSYYQKEEVPVSIQNLDGNIMVWVCTHKETITSV